MHTLYMANWRRRDSARRLPLRQIGPSLHPGGACLFSEQQKRITERRSGTIGSDEEGSMDQMILCARAMMALRWWTSVAPWETEIERV